MLERLSCPNSGFMQHDHSNRRDGTRGTCVTSGTDPLSFTASHPTQHGTQAIL